MPAARRRWRCAPSSLRLAGPDELAAARAEHERLLRLVGSMSEEDRLVIGYRYFLGLSEDETAEALGVARGTVKSRLSRALVRLREQMGAAA